MIGHTEWGLMIFVENRLLGRDLRMMGLGSNAVVAEVDKHRWVERRWMGESNMILWAVALGLCYMDAHPVIGRDEMLQERCEMKVGDRVDDGALEVDRDIVTVDIDTLEHIGVAHWVYESCCESVQCRK